MLKTASNLSRGIWITHELHWTSIQCFIFAQNGLVSLETSQSNQYRYSLERLMRCPKTFTWRVSLIQSTAAPVLKTPLPFWNSFWMDITAILQSSNWNWLCQLPKSPFSSDSFDNELKCAKFFSIRRKKEICLISSLSQWKKRYKFKFDFGVHFRNAWFLESNWRQAQLFFQVALISQDQKAMISYFGSIQSLVQWFFSTSSMLRKFIQYQLNFKETTGATETNECKHFQKDGSL